MKKLTMLLALFLSVTLTLSAQNDVKSTDIKKTIIKIADDSYSLKVTDADGFVIQEGEYLTDGKTLIPHGTWTLFAHKSDEILTRIKYDKGQKIWLETIIDGKMKRMDKDDITIHKLETRIASLEKKIESID